MSDGTVGGWLRLQTAKPYPNCGFSDSRGELLSLLDISGAGQTHGFKVTRHSHFFSCLTLSLTVGGLILNGSWSRKESIVASDQYQLLHNSGASGVVSIEKEQNAKSNAPLFSLGDLTANPFFWTPPCDWMLCFRPLPQSHKRIFSSAFRQG